MYNQSTIKLLLLFIANSGIYVVQHSLTCKYDFTHYQKSNQPKMQLVSFWKELSRENCNSDQDINHRITDIHGHGSILGTNKNDYYIDEKRTNGTSPSCEADANHTYIFSVSVMVSGTAIPWNRVSEVSHEKIFMLTKLRNLVLAFIFVIWVKTTSHTFLCEVAVAKQAVIWNLYFNHLMGSIK